MCVAGCKHRAHAAPRSPPHPCHVRRHQRLAKGLDVLKHAQRHAQRLLKRLRSVKEHGGVRRGSRERAREARERGTTVRLERSCRSLPAVRPPTHRVALGHVVSQDVDGQAEHADLMGWREGGRVGS